MRYGRSIRALLLGFGLLTATPAQAENLKQAETLSTELLRLYRAGNYTEAIRIAKQVLAIREKALGPTHPDVATTLNNLAALYKRQGRYDEAETLYKRSLAIKETALGPNHPSVATTLNNLALLYQAQGRYAAAEPLFKRDLTITEKALGPAHPVVANTLNNLAALYRVQGRYAEAKPLYKRSLAIKEKALGPNHLSVATTLNNLALLYQAQGRYEEAEPLYKRDLAITEKALGPAHPSVATTLNNLAGLYESQGRYAEAEPFYRRCLAIVEMALGPSHPDVATTLNNLAALYESQGRYAEAEPLYKRSLAIREKALGPTHSSVAITLNNLAGIYRAQGRYAAAEPLYKRCLAIVEKALGPNHPSFGITLNNLAVLYRAQGRHAEAEPLYKRSLAIREKELGPSHPSVATTLNNLATLYGVQGHYAVAEPLFKRSLLIRKRALGLAHPDVAAAHNNLAALYYAQSDWQRATDHYRRGTAVLAERTHRGSENIGQRPTGKRKSEATRSSFDFHLFVKSAYRLSQRRNDGTASEMFKTAQWSSSSEAAGSLAKMAARTAKGVASLASLVRERQDLVEQWQRRDAWRTAAVSRPPGKRNAEQEAKNTARLDAIDKRIAEIDTRLKTEFPDYAALANPEPLSIAQVQAQLRPDEALVLFLDTRASKPTPEETFIWVVTKTASRWVRSDIGPTALRQHVDALRCGLDVAAWSKPNCAKLLGVTYRGEDDWKSGNSPPFQLKRAHAFYQALFGQIEDLIKGKHLLIVPSGPLTQLPFQVLVTKKPSADAVTRTAFLEASWLAKHHAITVLPSVSSLQALRARAKPNRATKPFIGFGNPLLDGDEDDPKQQAAARLARTITGCASPGTMRTASLRGMHRAIRPLRGGTRTVEPLEIRAQAPLPETADELCAVARGAGTNADALYLGKRATEKAIKDLSANGTLASYRVLHFSTHGALAGELTTSREPGLILTPPQMPTEKDDGYLSASDVAGLKLDADWVILSACNTAGGADAKNAEALSGLARAFFYAGARSLLVSHWYVDSHATVSLITKAFDELRGASGQSVGRSEALRRAMLHLMQTGDRTWHPAYWAPFVVVGEGGQQAARNDYQRP